MSFAHYFPSVNILPKADACVIVQQAIAANTTAHTFQRGGLIDLRGLPQGTEFFIVGDLHGRREHLERILLHSEMLSKIEARSAILILLGDAVHYEGKKFLADEVDARRLFDMSSSLATLMSILQLKVRNPDSVFYVLGNHDYLSKKFTKAGVAQGWLLRKYMKETYGESFVREYEKFIASSPLMVVGNGLVANHAGPCDDTYTLADLMVSGIAGNEDDPLVEQLQWRRWKYYRPEHLYSEAQVQRFLTTVIGQPDALYLVGHSPHLLYYDEYRTHSFCARLMENHYMIFAAFDDFGYVRFCQGSRASTAEFIPLSIED